METKSINITPPEGYEIDQENSTFEKIVFKPIEVSTYDNIAKKLFEKEKGYYIEKCGEIIETNEPFGINYCDPNNALSEEQLKCILAKNKLANVARYLNGDWKPKNIYTIACYYLYYHPGTDTIGYCKCTTCTEFQQVLFKSKELAQQAIEILGKEEVKLALKPLY